MKNTKVRRALGGALAALGLALAAPIVAAPSASADTSYATRVDYYPSDCHGAPGGGYIAFLFHWRARSSDGARILDSVGIGNNSSCYVYPQRLNEYWSGTAPIPCPSTRLFRGVVTNARLSPYGSPLNDGPDTWTWTNPFAGEWVSKAGHVKWGMNPTVAPSSNGPFWVFAVPAC
jgi:hypothetical protein